MTGATEPGLREPGQSEPGQGGPGQGGPGRPDRIRREVVSFVRRSARMNPQQARAWDAHHHRWVIDVRRGETHTSIDPLFTVDLAEVFGRTAPLIIEIGPGMGDSLVPMAAERHDANVLAFEVFQPAVGRILGRLASDGVENVRVVQADVVDGLTTMMGPGAVDSIWMFFPDPWHKARHHKRRLLTREFADLVASRMTSGGSFRLATDWEDYAGQMRDVLDDHPDFVNDSPGGWAARWEDRPVTRFEQRGLDAGRHIFDLGYQRR